MKRTFQVIRGGRYNDVQGVEENRTARSKYSDQKAFLARVKEMVSSEPVWDNQVQINRILSHA